MKKQKKKYNVKLFTNQGTFLHESPTPSAARRLRRLYGHWICQIGTLPTMDQAKRFAVVSDEKGYHTRLHNIQAILGE